MDAQRFEPGLTSRERRVVLVDTETTGLSATARIVEVAAVEADPRTGGLGRSLHWLVNPGVPIPEVVTRIHGIGQGDVAGKPTFEAVAGELGAFLRGATFVAQNAAFDRRMLDAEFARTGRPQLADLDVQIIDALAVSRALFPLAGNHRLDALCDRAGVDRSERRRHGALLDVELLAGVLPWMAAAYDAWRAGESVEDSRLERFERQLRTMCDALETLAQTPLPEAAERAFLDVASAIAWLRRWESGWLERAERKVPEAGWCTNRCSARWSSSEAIWWKGAALAYIAESALDDFKSEHRVTTVRSSSQAGARRPLELATLDEVAESFQSTQLEVLLNAALTARQVRERLDGARQALRATLIAAEAEGYLPRNVSIRTDLRCRTDYRAAVDALAPDADLTAFQLHHRSLQLRSRDATACELLFGQARSGRTSLPRARVA